MTEKVAIVGSRDFPFMEMVIAYVRTLPEGTTVISGGARGVDRIAWEQARKRGLQIRVIRPDYEAHAPKLAPLVRNGRIAAECDRMVAFWDGLSGGTANAIAWATFLRKPVDVRMA